MITRLNNFCRVFEIPEIFPNGFLFGGGKEVAFKMVDWFNPIPGDDIRNDEVKHWPEYVPMLRDFLSVKKYLKEDRSYLLLTDFGESFVFRKGESEEKLTPCPKCKNPRGEDEHGTLVCPCPHCGDETPF